MESKTSSSNTLVCIIPTRGNRAQALAQTIECIRVWATSRQVVLSIYVALDGIDFLEGLNLQGAKALVFETRCGQDATVRQALKAITESSDWVVSLEDDLRSDVILVLDSLWNKKHKEGWHFVNKKGQCNTFRLMRHAIAKACSGKFSVHSGACSIASKVNWQKVVDLQKTKLWQVEGNRKNWLATSSIIQMKEKNLPTTYDAWANLKLVKQIVFAYQDLCVGIMLCVFGWIGWMQFYPKAESDIASAKVFKAQGEYVWESTPQLKKSRESLCFVEVPNNSKEVFDWVGRELRANIKVKSIDLSKDQSGWKIEYETPSKECAFTEKKGGLRQPQSQK